MRMRKEYRVVQLHWQSQMQIGWPIEFFDTEEEAKKYLDEKEIAPDLMSDICYSILTVWTNARKN